MIYQLSRIIFISNDFTGHQCGNEPRYIWIPPRLKKVSTHDRVRPLMVDHESLYFTPKFISRGGIRYSPLLMEAGKISSEALQWNSAPACFTDDCQVYEQEMLPIQDPTLEEAASQY